MIIWCYYMHVYNQKKGVRVYEKLLKILKYSFIFKSIVHSLFSESKRDSYCVGNTILFYYWNGGGGASVISKRSLPSPILWREIMLLLALYRATVTERVPFFLHFWFKKNIKIHDINISMPQNGSSHICYWNFLNHGSLPNSNSLV